jgi:2-polyprenyl-6-hydroxyphenyl methylase / 3-demethylubiquinone-9 3-methyltransferase
MKGPITLGKNARLTAPAGAAVDGAVMELFDDAEVDWWDENGVTRWLHRYNRVRVGYIREAACRRFGRDPTQPDCLSGLRLLDIGCGAGVLCEPLARLGATVIGIDPGQNIIWKARAHALHSGVEVEYRCALAEELAEAGEYFDVVLAMEVVEHVPDAGEFMERCALLVKPGGLFILSTLNRTFKSFAFAIVMAEYVLRLLPRGAHQWNRFVTPAEMGATMMRSGLTVKDVTGVTFNILARVLQLAKNTEVNYILTAERPV